MSTFTDPAADAAESSDALRGLAHASRVFDDPSDTYPVIGDLLAAVRSMRQAIDQIAAVHLHHQNQVTDEARDYTGGAVEARTAADELHQAAVLIGQAHDRLNAAMSHSGRIVWQPQQPPVERWVGVVFLQGDEADQILDLVDADGVEAGIEQLSQWDYGDETTSAAIVNGDVHDTAPVYPGGRQAEAGDYMLTYNPRARHVALYRRHSIPAADALDPDDQPAAQVPGVSVDAAARPVSAGGRGPVQDGRWFEHPAAAPARRGRSL